jgi:hypothetical protein
MGSKRVHLTSEILKLRRREKDSETSIAGGGTALLATPQHALDGPEHLEATETDQKLATAAHSGLLPPLSGDATDALRGDGSWGALLTGSFLTTSFGGQDDISTVAASGSAETLDLADGNWHDLTLTADCTITLTGATAGVGCSMLVLLRQDGTGGRTVTWPGSVSWPGGAAPVLADGAGDVTLVSLLTLDGGTNWFGAFPGSGGGNDAGHREVLMTTGIADPPDPLLSSDGSDWLYGTVT